MNRFNVGDTVQGCNFGTEAEDRNGMAAVVKAILPPDVYEVEWADGVRAGYVTGNLQRAPGLVTFHLPFPSAKLNPNNSKGRHWTITSKLRKDAREFAYLQARHVCCGQALFGAAGDVPLTVTFIMPDRRARDRDNLLAALKSSLDGVAEAIGVNDSRFEPITIRREYGRKPGEVRIEIGRAV